MLFENAGGSKVLASSVDRLSDYLLDTNVQHGASYEVSAIATRRVEEAQQRLAKLFNAKRPEELD